MNSLRTIRSTAALLVMVGVLCVYSFINAQTWTNAPSVPPANNVSVPVNIGSTAQDKNGTFTANKLGSIATTPVLELIDADAGQKDWRLGVEGGNSFVVRADRTQDTPTIDWGNDGNNQMVLYNGPDNGADYVQFSNQVRASEYCTRDGSDCLSAYRYSHPTQGYSGMYMSSRGINSRLNSSGDVTFYSADADTANFLCREQFGMEFGYWGTIAFPNNAGWRGYSNLAISGYDAQSSYGRRVMCSTGTACDDGQYPFGQRLTCYNLGLKMVDPYIGEWNQGSGGTPGSGGP